MSMLDHKLKPEPEPLRRLEVITGTGRRRRFSDEDKASIVEETLAPGVVVSEVARRHGLSPQQLFGWRRQARQPVVVTSADTQAPQFVPAVIEAELPETRVRRRSRSPMRQADHFCGIIAIELAGVTVRVGRGADAKTVATVLRALKADA